MDVAEARKNLERTLTEELRNKYFSLLRQLFTFKSSFTKSNFDIEIRKILMNGEQIRAHNYFLLALLSKSASSRIKPIVKAEIDQSTFECADYSDFIETVKPTLCSNLLENRTASSELFLPDFGFVAIRIAVSTWENGLDGATDEVTELIVHACQVFVKNIITAMISKKKAYCVRDSKFQFGFNTPKSDYFTKYYTNIGSAQLRRKRRKLTSSRLETNASSSYGAQKKSYKQSNLLTVELLYDCIKSCPQLLGVHELKNVALLKLSQLAGT